MWRKRFVKGMSFSVLCGSTRLTEERKSFLINRQITDEEYEEAEAYMEALGIEDGYIQQKESSDQSFIPVFDGTGAERAAGSHTKK